MNSRTIVDPGQAVGMLEELRGDIAPLLAENGQSFDRLRSTFLIAVQQNPDILKCTPESIRREVSKCAADGLVPDSREAVLLPYYDKDEKAQLANYQPMVYGIIKRTKELGSVFNIVCELVCQNDTFAFNAADPDSLSHSWDVFSREPRGSIRAAYVIFRDHQKRVMHREIMTLAELQSVRNASKAPNSPAWKNFEGEMYQKAVLRRGSKYISINNDKIRALIERQDEMFDFRPSPSRQIERVDPFTGEVLDATPARAALSAPAEDRQAINATRASAAAPREKEMASNKVGAKDAPPQQSEQKVADAEEKAPEEKTRPLPPQVPAVSIEHADKDRIVEGVTKILAIGLDTKLKPRERHENLKAAAEDWKDAIPEYARPLLKACIDMTNWTIRQQADVQPWQADHAAFVHKIRGLLDVKQLAIGIYP